MIKKAVLSTVTLFSNGVFEVFDEIGHQVPEFTDRFCNVWPALYKRLKEQELEGGHCTVCIGDWWGGRVSCNAEALQRFYEEQLKPVFEENETIELGPR